MLMMDSALTQRGVLREAYRAPELCLVLGLLSTRIIGHRSMWEEDLESQSATSIVRYQRLTSCIIAT